MFKKGVYVQRRKQLMHQLESGLILLLANDDVPMNYPANPYHFRQDSSFLYYIGIDDPGAESRLHYAGDITRTFPVDGRFTLKQKEIYEIVLKAQLAAIAAIRPGVMYRDVHLAAARIIADGLKSIGILKGDIDDAVTEGVHALFFPHGIGHMLGLDVHDMEDLGEDYVGYDENIQRKGQFGLAYLRLARELKPGFVVTVEPGLYFIPALITKWQHENKFNEFINYAEVERYKDFGGVRIEDDVLVTDKSHRVLGKPIPKTINEVEAHCIPEGGN